jgi:hypothetical protein
MSQTLRRELRVKFEEILLEEGRGEHTYDITVGAPGLAEKLADAALSVAGIAKRELPPGAGIDWGLAAGMSSQEIADGNAKMIREREVAKQWEEAMGYNPLPWWSEEKLTKLLRFLMTKTTDEIKTFAFWCRRSYSSFGPEKARDKPERVEELWNLAFAPSPAQQNEPEYRKL